MYPMYLYYPLFEQTNGINSENQVSCIYLESTCSKISLIDFLLLVCCHKGEFNPGQRLKKTHTTVTC